MEKQVRKRRASEKNGEEFDEIEMIHGRARRVSGKRKDRRRVREAPDLLEDVSGLLGGRLGRPRVEPRLHDLRSEALWARRLLLRHATENVFKHTTHNVA